MAEKTKTEIFLSPLGVAKWPHLNTPDEYEGTLKFKCDLILSEENAEKLIEKIEDVMPAAKALYEKAVKDAKAKGKKLKAAEAKEPTYAVMDGDRETGETAFKFSSNAQFTAKDGTVIKRTIPFFSAGGKPLTGAAKPNLWGGSKIRIGYSLYPYFNAAANNYGVSLRIEAVKVIDPVTGGGSGSSARYGMDEVEDGYEGDNARDTDTSSTDDADDSTTDDSGDGPAF